MRKATVISAGLHAAVLLWATVSFSSRSMDATPTESLPIDIVTDSQFTQLTKGAKDAEKKPDLKPLVEKVAPEEKTADEVKPKVTPKQEVQATKPKEATPTPPPEPKPAEKKETKAAEKPVPVAEKKADPIADELKKEAAKKDAKVEPKPLPPKKPPVPHKKEPEFDPAKIAALLDQRDPTRHAATGAALNQQASLGRANGSAAKLSANEIEAFRRKVSECWQPPLGADGSQDIQVVFRVMFNPDGTVKRGPDLVEAAASPLGPIFAESARRALLQCQPYTMLRKETYDQWKDLEPVFSLRDMFR